MRHLVALLLLMIGVPAMAEEPVSFKRDVAPILLERCQACHGPKKVEGGYRVDNFEHAMSAGDSQAAGFVSGDLAQSEAFRRITSGDADERMPAEADPLPLEQVALVKRWIEEGAKFDGDDPKAALTSIIPPPLHPNPPEDYSRTLPITALAFSEDGSELFVGGYHEVTVWNPADGKLLRRLRNVGQRTYELQPSPDGKLLAVAGGTPGKLGEVRLLNPATGELLRVVGTAPDVVLDAAFSPDGSRIAVAVADNTARIYEVSTGNLQLIIGSHSDWVSAVAWKPDGSQIATGSRDKTAKVFQARSGEPIISFNDQNNSVRGVLFHPLKNQVYSSGADNRVLIWNISDGKKAKDVQGLGGEVYKLQAAAKSFVAPCADKSVRRYDLIEGKPVREYRGHTDAVLSAAISNDGQRIAGGGFDGQVRVWNAEDGAQISQFYAAPGYVRP